MGTRVGIPLVVFLLLTLAGCGANPRAAREAREAEASALARSRAREASLTPGEREALARTERVLESGRAAGEAESPSEALRLCREAWRTRLSLLGAMDVRTAAAALAVAQAEFDLAHDVGADSMAAAARSAFVAELGPEHPRVADVEELLGLLVKNFSAEPDKFEQSLAHYRMALRIRTRTEGPNSLPVAETLHDLGNLERQTRHDADAYAHFRRAWEIRRARVGPVDDLVASTLSGMAFLRAGQGRWAESEALARASLTATPPTAGPATRAQRLALQGQMLRQMGRPAEAEPILRTAVAARESLWARTPRDEGSSIVAGLGIYRDLALALAAEGRGDEAFEQLERGLARTLMNRVLGASAGIDPWRGLLPRVQRLLDDDEALISWPRTTTTMFVPDYPLYACIVRAHGPVRWVRIDRRTPVFPRNGSVRSTLWMETRAAAGWPLRVRDTTTVARLAALMGREWFTPLEPALEGVRRIVVFAPELVAGGPLAMLRDADGRYLGDRFTISYAPSALLFALAREHERSGAAENSRPALLVGDPAYPDSASHNWPRLAGMAQEIRALAAEFPSATVLMGRAATAARVRSMAADGGLGRFGVLHFATHADEGLRNSLESALILAPDGRGPVSRLTAREIVGWHLDADLVSLAACRTTAGLGSPTEGALGLQLAFLSAGGRSLLVTLWPVDDHAAARLIESFYARLLGPRRMDRAEALREAQLDLRRWRGPDGTRPYAHPAYWAAFALIGDPGTR